MLIYGTFLRNQVFGNFWVTYTVIRNYDWKYCVFLQEKIHSKSSIASLVSLKSFFRLLDNPIWWQNNNKKVIT